MFTNKKITTNLSYCFYFAWICHEFCLYCFKKQVEIKFMFKEHLQWYYLLVKIAILLFIWLLLDCFLVFRAIHTTSSVFGILTKWFLKSGRWSKNEFLIQDCLVGISKMDLELPCKRIQLDSHCIVDSLWQSRNLLLLILVNIFLRLKDGNGTWFCGNRIFQHKIA